MDEFWSEYTAPFALGGSDLAILLITWMQAKVGSFVQKITGSNSAT
ncbi:MAG TPA: hypothetical protein VLA72_15775 [Anaerolineales bacterium]|nr:hypothetical protein [Anaerolineales bacterium]